MTDIDYKNSGLPEMARYEHRRKNVGVKAVVPHGYDPTSDTFLPLGIVANPDGTYSLPTSAGVYKTKIDKATTDIIYIGKAAAGSALSSAVWQIGKVDKTVTDNVTITHTGNTAIWNNRASETYS